jgi:hypothetical protein
MQALDLDHLVRTVGRRRLAAYGVTAIGTVFEVLGEQGHDFGRGTILKITPGQHLTSLMAGCPDFAYPRQLVALLAEILEAMTHQGYDSPPLPSELVALAQELRWHRNHRPCDLLVRSKQLDSQVGPFVHVPHLPSGLLRPVDSAATYGPLVNGGLDHMEAQIAAIPAEEWQTDLLTYFTWFGFEPLGDFFGFLVAQTVPDAEYDFRDITEARATLFGWTPPLLPAGIAPDDKQILSLLNRAPTDQRAIP